MYVFLTILHIYVIVIYNINGIHREVKTVKWWRPVGLCGVCFGPIPALDMGLGPDLDWT